jgi:hypothetical protein
MRQCPREERAARPDGSSIRIPFRKRLFEQEEIEQVLRLGGIDGHSAGSVARAARGPEFFRRLVAPEIELRREDGAPRAELVAFDSAAVVE